jgi:twitching motility protein PilT
MQTLEKVLAELYHSGEITFEAALSKTSKPDELQRLLGPKAGAATGGREPDRVLQRL